MDLSSLLTPWLALAAVLIPLAYAERWIHSHLYGVGWLLTNEPRSATALYYLFLSPGVFVHEFVQWLVAGALNVETKRVMAWPEAQEDGTLRLDFVQPVQAGRLATAIIGAAPLIVGLAIIGYISTSILNLDAFLSALQSGDITIIGPAARALASTADFYLWLYLMFALANAMLPTPEERSGWLVVLGLFAAVLAFLVIIGVGDVLVETFTGPVAHAVNLLTTAFGTILALEVGAIVVIGFVEEVLERLTKRKFDYSTAPPEKFVREPGSNLPLAPGQPFPSIYNFELPLPDPAIQPELDAKKRRTSMSGAGARIQPPEGRATPAPASGRERLPGPTPHDTGETPALPQRSAAPPGGLRRSPDLAEASSTPAPRDRPGALREPLKTAGDRPLSSGPPRREPISAPSPERRGNRPAPERPARPAGAAPAPIDRGPVTPFGSQPLNRSPASDRQSPPGARAYSPRGPSGSTPQRPFPLAKTDEKGEPREGAPDTSGASEEDVEYVDFDDL